MSQLGAVLLSTRKSRRISAVQLAEATRDLGFPIHRVAIARIERGEKPITVPELVALSRALSANPQDWLSAVLDGMSIDDTEEKRRATAWERYTREHDPPTR